jgi:haloalkane dehalogenase
MDVLRTPEDRFADLPGFPFTPHYAELSDGLRMHYVDEGPRAAQTVLLLHGQPTWSYLYRKVVDGLVAHGLRAVAPDLVGFGRSDKPAMRTAHTVGGHVAWMTQFVDAVRLRNVTLVVQDWGGPIGLGVLAQRPGLAARVVAANTALHTVERTLEGRLAWPVHATDDATVTIAPMLLDYQRLTQELEPLRPSLFVQGATASQVPENVLAAYDAPFPDESFCAGPRQLPLLMGLTPSSACAQINRHTFDALSHFERPFVTAFSDGDPGTGGWAAVLQERVPGAQGRRHVTIAGAGHFLQEDRGAELADVVARVVGETPNEPAA